MDKVRIGIIGVGNMGSSHADTLFKNEIENAELSAICDKKATRLKWSKDTFGDKVKTFEEPEELFKSGLIDAVIIATPHYDHPTLAIRAAEYGFHVLIEKPAGVYTKKVREMNEALEKSGKVFGIMYNQRTNPLYQKLKNLIDSGELGEIKRSIWIITDWYRSQSYYDSGDWRATWAGEGGGVLLNQDPHQLDLWQWTCGMPKRIRAFMAFGKFRNIEVEDDVTAYVEYENGATGLFVTTTGEAPGTNRFEISGDKGKIVIENGNMIFWRLRVSEKDFNKSFQGGFGKPECWKCEIPIEGVQEGHLGIIRNFIKAILNNTTLLAPGIDGIKGLTISNAMHLSAWTDNWVDLPMDEELFYEKLQEKIKTSKYKKITTNKALDVEGTF